MVMLFFHVDKITFEGVLDRAYLTEIYPTSLNQNPHI